MTRSKKIKPSSSYDDWVIDSLKDKKEAAAYLQVALDEYQEDGDTAAFMIALRHVAKARGGVGQLAESTSLSRETLYRTLSSQGNPRFKTLGKLLHALGFHMVIEAV